MSYERESQREQGTFCRFSGRSEQLSQELTPAVSQVIQLRKREWREPWVAEREMKGLLKKEE